METYQQYFTGTNPNLLGFTIIGIATGFKLRFNNGPTLPPEEALKKLASAVDRLDEETFEALCLKGFKTSVNNFCRNSNDAWGVIQELLSRELQKRDDPVDAGRSPDPERSTNKPQPSNARLKTSGAARVSTILPRTYQAPEVHWGEKQKITPRATTTPRPSPPRPREETIIQFIARRAPSINYLQGFILMSRHTNNHLSRRGRKVYPYGQEYLAKKLGISLATVERIFSWLRRKGIIFKRSNENPELHKSATWFVCTSWKQSAYFRDPEGRRPKKGSRRSPRK